jgi:thymidine kinase
MVTEGEVIVVGDTGDDRDGGDEGGAGHRAPEVGYEVLCRQHHRRGLTAARARAVSMIGEPLPFG